jgi:NitT/TauT family transport system substrate-binding protein
MPLLPRCLAVLALAAFCASALAQAPQRIVLLVDEYKAIRNVPLIVAERLGYLQGQSIRVTVMNVRDDIAHADMLADGRVDAVMAYWHHNVVNVAAGRPSQAIVTLGVTPGAKVLVSHAAKARYRTLADLKGSRFIAGGAGSSKSTVANALLLEGGHRITDYTRLGTDGKERNIAALRDGTADFVVAPVPDGDAYEAAGVASVFADLTTVQGTRQALGALFPSSTVFMASAHAGAHPGIAQHLATAFVKTLAWMNSHSPEEIAALVPVEVSGKDRAAYLALLRQELPMFATDGRMPADGAAKELHVLAEFNDKYRAVAAEQTYTNAFVDVALKPAP